MQKLKAGKFMTTSTLPQIQEYYHSVPASDEAHDLEADKDKPAKQKHFLELTYRSEGFVV